MPLRISVLVCVYAVIVCVAMATTVIIFATRTDKAMEERVRSMALMSLLHIEHGVNTSISLTESFTIAQVRAIGHRKAFGCQIPIDANVSAYGDLWGYLLPAGSAVEAFVLSGEEIWEDSGRYGKFVSTGCLREVHACYVDRDPWPLVNGTPPEDRPKDANMTVVPMTMFQGSYDWDKASSIRGEPPYQFLHTLVLNDALFSSKQRTWWSPLVIRYTDRVTSVKCHDRYVEHIMAHYYCVLLDNRKGNQSTEGVPCLHAIATVMEVVNDVQLEKMIGLSPSSLTVMRSMNTIIYDVPYEECFIADASVKAMKKFESIAREKLPNVADKEGVAVYAEVFFSDTSVSSNIAYTTNTGVFFLFNDLTPKSFFFADLQRVRDVNIFITSAVILFIVLVSAFMWLCIAQPLQNISKRMHRATHVLPSEAEESKLLSRRYRASQHIVAEVRDLHVAYTELCSALRELHAFAPQGLMIAQTFAEHTGDGQPLDGMYFLDVTSSSSTHSSRTQSRRSSLENSTGSLARGGRATSPLPRGCNDAAIDDQTKKVSTYDDDSQSQVGSREVQRTEGILLRTVDDDDSKSKRISSNSIVNDDAFWKEQLYQNSNNSDYTTVEKRRERQGNELGMRVQDSQACDHKSTRGVGGDGDNNMEGDMILVEDTPYYAGLLPSVMHVANSEGSSSVLQCMPSISPPPQPEHFSNHVAQYYMREYVPSMDVSSTAIINPTYMEVGGGKFPFLVSVAKTDGGGGALERDACVASAADSTGALHTLGDAGALAPLAVVDDSITVPDFHSPAHLHPQVTPPTERGSDTCELHRHLPASPVAAGMPADGNVFKDSIALISPPPRPSHSHRPPTPAFAAPDTSGAAAAAATCSSIVATRLSMPSLLQRTALRPVTCTMMLIRHTYPVVNTQRLCSDVERLMRDVIAVVLRSGGVVEAFQPDVMSVSFGAHCVDAQHARRGIRCALRVSRVLTATQLARTRIALDSGTFHVGTCGGHGRFARVVFGERLDFLHAISQDDVCFGRIITTDRAVQGCTTELAVPIDNIVTRTGRNSNNNNTQKRRTGAHGNHNITAATSASAFNTSNNNINASSSTNISGTDIYPTSSSGCITIDGPTQLFEILDTRRLSHAARRAALAFRHVFTAAVSGSYTQALALLDNPEVPPYDAVIAHRFRTYLRTLLSVTPQRPRYCRFQLPPFEQLGVAEASPRPARRRFPRITLNDLEATNTEEISLVAPLQPSDNHSHISNAFGTHATLSTYSPNTSAAKRGSGSMFFPGDSTRQIHTDDSAHTTTVVTPSGVAAGLSSVGPLAQSASVAHTSSPSFHASVTNTIVGSISISKNAAIGAAGDSSLFSCMELRTEDAAMHDIDNDSQEPLSYGSLTACYSHERSRHHTSDKMKTTARKKLGSTSRFQKTVAFFAGDLDACSESNDTHRRSGNRNRVDGEEEQENNRSGGFFDNDAAGSPTDLDVYEFPVFSIADPNASTYDVEEVGLPMEIRSSSGETWYRLPTAIGSGAFAEVYQAISTRGALIALKCIRLSAHNVNLEDVVSEVNTACKLFHDHIVHYSDWALVGPYLVLFMEYAPGGTLHRIVSMFPDGGLVESVARRYSFDALKGLAYLHKHNIVHADLKPQNILLAADGTCKISDFGSSLSKASAAAACANDVFSLRGTALYMSPEVAAGAAPSMRSDMWSFGITLYEMLTGRLPWQFTGSIRGQVEGKEAPRSDLKGMQDETASSPKTNVDVHTQRDVAKLSDTQFLRALIHGEVAPVVDPQLITSADARTLLCRCFEWQPEKRPRADELLFHPFFCQ